MDANNDKQQEKKLELLAPAGGKASFDAALNGGADAIYLGIDRFNARRQADNFSIDELGEVVKRAHIKGTKIYVTFNTLVSDGELADAVENLAMINNAGVDSIIVQDFGVLEIVRQLIPGLNVHASTQMNAHNIPMVKFLEGKGVKRITLARELSISEIAEICESTDVEIETFIHGALCFSYSGQCLFSSMVGNRSGNRGFCPQACRMGYGLVAAGDGEDIWPTPGKHILSMRDLCGIRLIPELANAGVRALKIEGRMKSPEYVAIVTSIYRKAIDRYYNDPDSFSVSDEEINNLKEIFSRGFTEGYLRGERDSGLMSYDRPSDRGILIGRVTYLDVYTGKLGLQLKHELCIGDEVEIWVSRGGRMKLKVEELYVADKPVQCAPVGSKAVIMIKGKRHLINTGDRVFRVNNEGLVKKARDIISGTDADRIPLDIVAQISIGQPVKLRARAGGMHGGKEFEVVSNYPAEKGETRTLTEADVIAQLNRLGNTAYSVNSWDIQVEPGAMVPLGKLNELRRTLVEKLELKNLITFRRSNVKIGKVKENYRSLMESKKKEVGRRYGKPVLAVDVTTTDQAIESIDNGADWLYMKPGYSNKGGIDFDKLAIKRSGRGVKLAFAVMNVLHQEESGELYRFIENYIEHFDALLIDNFGMVQPVKQFGLPVFLDYHANIFNGFSAKTFMDEGVSRICLSPELTLEQIAAIKGAVEVEVEALIHGWLEVMTAEHCIPSASKKSCGLCTSRNFFIEDQKGYRFPVEQDTKCRSHVFNSYELYMLPNIPNLFDARINSLRLLLSRHNPRAAGKITSLYREAIDLVGAGVNDISSVIKKAEREIPAIKTSTTGHFFREVY